MISGNQPREEEHNIMSKVFERETHQSYERRAKNDLVVGYITEKFLSKPSPHASTLNVEEIVKQKNEIAAAQQEARLQARKQKEKEMKLVLDL